MRDFISLFAVIACSVFLVISAVSGICYLTESYKCSDLHRLTGLETDVSLGLGCNVKYKGRWVDGSVVTNNMQELTIREDK